VVDRLVERLRGRGRPAAARGDGDCRATARDCEHRSDESDEAGGGERAQELHGDPFGGACPLVVAPDSERSLKAGSSIVNRAPTTNARPPWRSAVARTIASPRPDPVVPGRARQNRSNA